MIGIVALSNIADIPFERPEEASKTGCLSILAMEPTRLVGPEAETMG